MNRGDIIWADFGTPQGSEPGYQRPAVVVSSDRFNHSRTQTVVVCPLTTQLKHAAAPGNVELEAGTANLPRPSVVLVAQPLTIDRRQVVEPIGYLATTQLRQVDTGLRLVLDLSAEI